MYSLRQQVVTYLDWGRLPLEPLHDSEPLPIYSLLLLSQRLSRAYTTIISSPIGTPNGLFIILIARDYTRRLHRLTTSLLL
jgi:hypothetical protein